MGNYLGKRYKWRIIFTTPNFRINGEPHNPKLHKRRTKCMYMFKTPKIPDLEASWVIAVICNKCNVESMII